MDLKKRLRNYGLWVSLASLVFLLLNNFGISVDESKFNGIVDAILTIFVLLGILNDPTTEKKGYGDDNEN